MGPEERTKRVVYGQPCGFCQAILTATHTCEGQVADLIARGYPAELVGRRDSAAERAKEVLKGWWASGAGRTGGFFERMNAQEAEWLRLMSEAIREAVAEEREACAKVADAAGRIATKRGDAAKAEQPYRWLPGAQAAVVATFAHVAQECDDIAAAIRARGAAPPGRAAGGQEASS